MAGPFLLASTKAMIPIVCWYRSQRKLSLHSESSAPDVTSEE